MEKTVVGKDGDDHAVGVKVKLDKERDVGVGEGGLKQKEGSVVEPGLGLNKGKVTGQETSPSPPDNAVDAAVAGADPQWRALFHALPAGVKARFGSLVDQGRLRGQDLDDRSMRELGEFPEDAGVDVLDEFVSHNLGQVRNKNAFLNAVMNRIRRDLRNQSGRYDPTVQRSGTGLPVAVQTAIERLVQQGVIKETDLDARCLDFLRSMDEAKGCLAIAEYASADFTTVRNRAALLMAICRRVKRGEDAPHPTSQPNKRPRNYEGAAGSASMFTWGHAQYQQQGMMQGRVPVYAPGYIAVYNPAQASIGVRLSEWKRRCPHHSSKIEAPLALLLQTHYDEGLFDHTTFDDQAWNLMVSMPGQQAIEVIREIVKTMRHNPAHIRKPAAFFMRLAKKHMQGQMTTGGPPQALEPSGWTTNPASESEWKTLPPAVVRRIDQLCSTHPQFAVSRSSFDSRVLAVLRGMEESTANGAVDEMFRKDLSQVRNFSAAFMGICKRMQPR